MPDATRVEVPVQIGVIEEDAPRVARNALIGIDRRRPVVAVGTRSDEIRVAPVTGSRKENAVAIGGGNYSSLYARTVIVCYPSPGTLFP